MPSSRSLTTQRWCAAGWVLLLLAGATSPVSGSGPLAGGHCDFNGDGRDDEAFGAPGDDVSVTLGDFTGAFDSGSVNILYGTETGGLSAEGNEWWNLDSFDFLVWGPSALQEASRFGESVACGDFNGDGLDDLAIGVPGFRTADEDGAGAVYVHYSYSGFFTPTPDRVWTQGPLQGSPQGGDGFGTVLAVGNFDGDEYDDLAVGVPAENVGDLAEAGAVNVLYGGEDGLQAGGNRLFTQASANVNGAAEEKDFFGFALASGDFDGDGFDDLAVGVPGEDVGNVTDAGAVNVLYGGGSGLMTQNRDQLWHQDSSGLIDAVGFHERFGWVLAAANFDGRNGDDLAVGVPGQDVVDELSLMRDGGAVHVLYSGGGGGLASGGDQLWDQTSSGVGDGAERYDRFGTALAAGNFDGRGGDDLAVGAPWDGIAGDSEAGVVIVLYGESPSGLGTAGADFWHQDRSGVNGVTEAFDRFGSSLASGDYDGDGRDDLTIGVPGEDVSGVPDAGAANVLYGTSTGLSSSGDQLWHRGSTGILATNGRFDRWTGLVKSDGVYRVPYTDSTFVEVWQDWFTHRPLRRVDLHAVGSGFSIVVAAADGRIVAIEDWHSATCDGCPNNYVWIEHDNGEWTKYSHLAANSVTGMGHWVGERVTAGTWLGFEDDVGHAHGEHLHFEVAVPWDPADALTPTGFINGVRRDPVICNIPGGTFLRGETVTAGPCPAGLWY